MPFLVIIPADYLAWVFFGPIRVFVPTATAGDINGVDSRGRGRALSFLFLILVAVILLLFSDLGIGVLRLVGG